MTLNRDVFQRDLTTFSIPNDGVTVIYEPSTLEEWDVLRYELESFVCEGEYAAGMQRVLSTYLGHLDQPRQPAVWVSGFYGSGKSHFVRVLRYLWQDVTMPDCAQARSLRALPSDVDELLRELSTAGRREGGLWAAAGTLGAGDQSIRLAILSILFRAAGLPERYAPARFVLWLRRQGILEAIRDTMEAQGESLEGELPHMYVSQILARSLLAAQPDLASSPREVAAMLRAQFPDKQQITGVEMNEAIKDVLALQSTRPGKWPLTLLVLDELQQSIGDDNDRTLQVQEIVQSLSSQFGSHILVVGTGQSALEDRPQLSKLRDRFTVTVTLSDQDVHRVLREVVLRKRPGRVPELRRVLDAASGEINRHLSGTRIAPRSEDDAYLVPDYPLLPARRRFWERLLRGVDVSGTAAQLRTQLRVVWEATRNVAGEPLGTVVPADVIYAQQKPSMLQRGLLLQDVSNTIAELDDGTPDGKLRSRLCATIFLIQQLPTEGVSASGVRSTPDMLADLLVENLPAGSAELRQRIPGLLEELVEQGTLMQVEGEYRLQTRESAEWERDRRARYQRILADAPRLASDRNTEFRNAVTRALAGVRLLQGESRTPRNYALHWSLEPPPTDGSDVPVWVRDGWSVTERTVLHEAQAAGSESPTVFVFLPRQEADELNAALAGHAAAEAVLAARAATQQTPEGIEARNSMQTRRDLERGRLDALVAGILSNARVYQGGGSEVTEGSLSGSVRQALEASLVRLFPQFHMADDSRWANVVRQASQGGPDALGALGYSGSAEQHPVCKEVLASLNGGPKTGLEVRRRFGGAGYGWPQDAVDGALMALLAADQVEALDRANSPKTARGLAQSAIGALTFRAALITITTIQRVAVRGLITGMGLPVRNGEEAEAVIRMLDHLRELAKEAGGEPPLPEVPQTNWVDELQAKSGNERLLAVFEARQRLRLAHEAWRHAGDLLKQRQPRWRVLNQLLARAQGLPVATAVQPQVEAILAHRSLLDEPDPVQPLISELATALRAALQEARKAVEEARERELVTLKQDPAWNKLNDGQWRTIFYENDVAPVDGLLVGTEAELLATLEQKPLANWRAEVAAMPARMQRAREQAARLLEPESVRVQPRSATLRTSDEVEAYLAELRAELLGHIDGGHPVLI